MAQRTLYESDLVRVNSGSDLFSLLVEPPCSLTPPPCYPSRRMGYYEKCTTSMLLCCTVHGRKLNTQNTHDNGCPYVNYPTRSTPRHTATCYHKNHTPIFSISVSHFLFAPRLSLRIITFIIFHHQRGLDGWRGMRKFLVFSYCNVPSSVWNFQMHLRYNVSF